MSEENDKYKEDLYKRRDKLQNEYCFVKNKMARSEDLFEEQLRRLNLMMDNKDIREDVTMRDAILDNVQGIRRILVKYSEREEEITREYDKQISEIESEISYIEEEHKDCEENIEGRE